MTKFHAVLTRRRVLRKWSKASIVIQLDLPPMAETLEEYNFHERMRAKIRKVRDRFK